MTSSMTPRHAAVALRKPQIANPYGRYAKVCGAIFLLSLPLGAFSLVLPAVVMEVVLALSIAAGSIALLSGLLLWPIARGAATHIQALSEGECLAYWTYPPEAWNRFAAQMRGELSNPRMVPLSLFPTCGLAAGLTLALLQHWAWLPACAGIGIAISAFAFWCERRYSLGRYQHVVGTAEVFITRAVLAVPGNTFVWNRLAPQLLNVSIDRGHPHEPRLVFHLVSQAKHRQIRSEVVLPIPAHAVEEAETIVAALTSNEALKDDDADELTENEDGVA